MLSLIGYFGLFCIVVSVCWALGSSTKKAVNSVPKSGHKKVKVKNEWDSTRRFYVQDARWDNKTASYVAVIKDSYGEVPSMTVSALFVTSFEKKIAKAMSVMQEASKK